ncbi:MAG TPA: threonine--tRNA ligase [Nevskiaceae bacterium]
MPIQITLPDGARKSFAAPPTALDIAGGISPRLAKQAVLAKVDGKLWDLTRPIERDADVELLTRDAPEALEVIRHDAAHVLAQAVQELYPGTQVTFGPATENGFYYDFARDTPFNDADLAAIEARMREIVKRDLPIRREVWPHDRAVKYFGDAGEKFKAEWIRDGIPAGAELTIYRQGDEWLDLCRGPHLPSTGRLGNAFKLMRVGGAYWRGDRHNAQLQRIYGVAFANEKALKAYLLQLEEAERRDHRRLGQQLDLFHLQDEAVGSVFWHPRGYTLWRAVENYIRRRLEAAGYVEVKTPILIDRVLWERSGHWAKFREQMFTAESEDRTLAVKPMNCPGHVQIFRQGIKSYRDLPLRMAEFGSCHRNEPSGSLHGLMRVRAFTQDDAHIFCMPSQINSETVAFCTLLLSVYRDFGFTDVHVKYSDRPELRAGDDATWDRAEAALRDALEATHLPYTLNPGEGAFYGPKLEFVLRDAIGRDWQCGTLQVDFVLPARLDAEYIAEDGSRQRPVMLHRAILGSMERFIGILIEQHAGALPAWLSPVQVVVATIVSDADDYAREVAAALRDAGLRVEADLRNEKISYKIREHATMKVPVIAVIGRTEAEARTVTLRERGQQKQHTVALAEAARELVAAARAPA